MMIQEELGKRIRELRTTNTGLSQEKFAHKIEMDRTYFASVEAGKRNISITNIKKIADGLHLTQNGLASNVPIWYLECLPDEEAAKLCCQTIAREIQ